MKHDDLPRVRQVMSAKQWHNGLAVKWDPSDVYFFADENPELHGQPLTEAQLAKHHLVLPMFYE